MSFITTDTEGIAIVIMPGIMHTIQGPWQSDRRERLCQPGPFKKEGRIYLVFLPVPIAERL